MRSITSTHALVVADDVFQLKTSIPQIIPHSTSRPYKRPWTPSFKVDGKTGGYTRVSILGIPV